MQIETGCYYHLYNRTNNHEVLFKSPENYAYFLKLFRRELGEFVDVLAYCLMPTHFHLLIRIRTTDIDACRNKVGVWISSYTKAINKCCHRHGSLFQQHTKARHVDDEGYLMRLIAYIHQNPLRARLARSQDEWEHSSYLELSGQRRASLINRRLVRAWFASDAEFRRYSAQWVESIDKRYWP